MKSLSSLKEQIRRNSVALISLAVAVSSLGYNTWRNEVWSADYDELESDVGAKDRIVSALVPGFAEKWFDPDACYLMRGHDFPLTSVYSGGVAAGFRVVYVQVIDPARRQ